MRHVYQLFASIALFTGSIPLSTAHTIPNFPCRCMPGDGCWPSQQDWTALNQTVNGRLIQTTPLASTCHFPTYNATDCDSLQEEWFKPETHDVSPNSIMAAAVSNETCSPFTDPSLPCLRGNEVVYAVNVSTSKEVVDTVNFAARRNIRLVIRNTGHDYLGKSTGRGALSIWVHNIKQVEFHDFVSSHYNGSAATVGAGVLGEEAYRAAHAVGKTIVGGDCGTVGPVGGYTQGGGHGGLVSRHGLAADQVLQWEVITSSGEHLFATPEQHADLYWALSGGGGGTYGVVLSMTVKTHPELHTTGVVLNYTSAEVGVQVFWESVTRFNTHLPTWSSRGAMTIAAITNDSLILTPITLPGSTAQQARDLIQPFLDDLTSLGIKPHLNITEFPDYFTHYFTLIFPNPTQLVQNAQYGGALVPKSVIEQDNGRLTEAIKYITSAGVSLVEIGLNVSGEHTGAYVDNAVLPAWRSAAMDVILASDWPPDANLDQMKIMADRMTEEWVPRLTDLTDHSSPEYGCYMNEADPQQADWKHAFYGRNYDRLEEIKDRYDPYHLFYAVTAVGSDRWEAQSDGRLCRASARQRGGSA